MCALAVSKGAKSALEFLPSKAEKQQQKNLSNFSKSIASAGGAQLKKVFCETVRGCIPLDLHVRDLSSEQFGKL